MKIELDAYKRYKVGQVVAEGNLAYRTSSRAARVHREALPQKTTSCKKHYDRTEFQNGREAVTRSLTPPQLLATKWEWILGPSLST